nr:aquaporin-3 [Quercus suber]
MTTMETQGLSNVSHESDSSDRIYSSKHSHEGDAKHDIHDQSSTSATHHEFAPSGAETTTLHKTSSGLRDARQHLGLHPNVPIIEEHDTARHSDLWWPKIRLVLKEPFAEFFGVFTMVLFGDGSVAQVLLSAGQTSAPGAVQTRADFRRRFPIYLIAQLLGGFVGAGVVYANYINEINAFEGHNIRTVPPSQTATAAIFCTYPQPALTKASQFFSEFIASTILMFVIFALKDDSNKGQFSASGSWFPLGLFFLIFGLGACFGWETGYAINLARDFGPRLMSYAVGYGSEVWSAGGYYFWIPMVSRASSRRILDS